MLHDSFSADLIVGLVNPYAHKFITCFVQCGSPYGASEHPDRVSTQLNSSIFVHFRYIVRIFLHLFYFRACYSPYSLCMQSFILFEISFSFLFLFSLLCNVHPVFLFFV